VPVLQKASDLSGSAGEDSSMLESTVDRLRGEVRELQRTLHARSAELAGADLDGGVVVHGLALWYVSKRNAMQREILP